MRGARLHLLAAAVGASLLIAGIQASTAPARKADDTLRVFIGGEPNIDPIVGSRAGQWVWGTFLDPLIAIGPRGNLLKTGVITNWTHPDPLTWRFTVRPGVRFTDGEPGNAVAVADTIGLNKAPGAILSTFFQNVRSIRAPNATTVVVRTARPQFDFAQVLTAIYLMPPKYYKQVGSAGFRNAPIGSGPFKVDSVQPGIGISVSPNPGYWGTKPSIGIDFSYAPDPEQRLALVESGAADVALELSPAEGLSAAEAKLKVLRVATAQKLMLYVFTGQAPLNDIDLRRAIALAIDRNAIVKGIFQNRYQANGSLMDVFPGQKATVSVAPNPTAARALVKGSPTVTLDYPTDRYVDMPEVAQAIAAMLENVGINVTLVPEPYATGIAKMLQGQMSGLLLTGLVPNVPDPNYPAQVLLTKTSVSRNCVDHRFDSLTAAALAKPNIAAAQPLYDRMDKLAVVDLACFVPLYWAVAYVAMSNDVNGLVLTPLNALYLDKVTKG